MVLLWLTFYMQFCPKGFTEVNTQLQGKTAESERSKRDQQRTGD